MTAHPAPTAAQRSCVDTESDPGSWTRAIARGCLAGRVVDYQPAVSDVFRDGEPPSHDEASSQ